MSNTKIIKPSVYEIAIIMQKGKIPATVNSTALSMDDPSARVLEYI